MLDFHFHLAQNVFGPGSKGKRIALGIGGALLSLVALFAVFADTPSPSPEESAQDATYPPGGWMAMTDAYGRPYLHDAAGNAVMEDAAGWPVFFDANGRTLFTGSGYVRDAMGDLVGDADNNAIPLDSQGHIVTHDASGALVRTDFDGRFVGNV